MRIKLHLERTSQYNVLPLSYQYELSSWIHSILNNTDEDFIEAVTEKGYLCPEEGYNCFCFSKFLIRDFFIDGDRLIMNSNTCVLTLSFYSPGLPESLFLNLFQDREFTLGDTYEYVSFRVSSIEKCCPPKIKGEMFFKCISPICIKWTNPRTGNIEHIHPDHKDYERLFFDDLVNKCQIGIPEEEQKDILIDDCFLQVITEPKAKFFKQKENSYKNKAYKFYFRLKAPRKLLIAGYYGGFGNYNSEGFGCVEVCNKEAIFKDNSQKPEYSSKDELEYKYEFS